MRVGLDAGSIQDLNLDVFGTLAFVRERGLAAVLIGPPTRISPTLDDGALREASQEARRLGLGLDVTVLTVNPYCAQAAVVALGGGDLRAGLERLIRAGHVIGCSELHGLLAGPHARIKSAVSWTQQLAAAAELLLPVRPLLRDLGCRINLETHGDATTFELVRLVEVVGDDVLGICLDPANLLLNVEDPVAAAQRAAPYVHIAHANDASLFLGDRGLVRQGCPCGQGATPWSAILPLLGAHAPDLTLAIEDHPSRTDVPIDDPDFLSRLPDLTPTELAQAVRVARASQDQADRPLIPDERDGEARSLAAKLARIDASRTYLRGLLADLEPPRRNARRVR